MNLFYRLFKTKKPFKSKNYELQNPPFFLIKMDKNVCFSKKHMELVFECKVIDDFDSKDDAVLMFNKYCDNMEFL